MAVRSYVEDNSGVHLATIDGVLIGVLHRPLKQSDLSRLDLAYQQVLTTPHQYLHVIEPLAGYDYDRNITKQYLELLDCHWDSMSLIAVGLLSENRFMGSIVRSMATAFLLRRSKKPVRVHESVASAVSWMNQENSQRISQLLVAEFLKTTRKAFRQNDS